MVTAPALVELAEQVESEYRARTPRSRELHAAAQERLPGGDSRTGTGWAPYPTYFTSGRGAQLCDADGNTVMDFLFNSTVHIHGFAHPTVTEAIQRQAARGTAWNAPTEQQAELARMLCERVPSLEQIRFTNSGTEANMQAIKAARAYTGRDVVLKMDGAYHGTYEGTEFNGPPQPRGDPAAITPNPVGRGGPHNALENIRLAPFDDAEIAVHLIEQHRHELAAVLVNPIMTRAWLSIPSPGYLEALREATREHDVPLIFDEVITLRVAPGGAQELYGVTPDLTVMGKIIGGGLPVGAFGGRADIMELFADRGPPAVPHAGTFNGNPITMAAGIAALEMLTPEAYERLAELGDLMRARLAAACREHGVAIDVHSVASVVGLGLPAQLAASADAQEVLRLLFLALLNRGFRAASLIVASTITTPDDIERLAGALGDTLREFRPAIEAAVPELVLSGGSAA